MLYYGITFLTLLSTAVAAPAAASCTHGDLWSVGCSNTYFHCVHGTAVNQPCPAGLKFNNDVDRCDWPANVDECNVAETNTTTTTTTTTTTEAPEEELNDERCKDKPVDTPFIEDENACVPGFSICGDGGYYYDMDCPASLRFNADKKYCDFAYNVPACVAKSRLLVCEHEKMTISCPVGQTIHIDDASYGRTEGPEVCPHPSIKDLSCHAAKSLSVMESNCQGKQECEVDAENRVFSDPCYGTFKYLWAEYSCK